MEMEKCDQNQQRELSGEVGRAMASGGEMQPTRSNLGVREPRNEIPQLPSPLLLVKPKGASGCRLCRPGSWAQSRVEEGGKGSRGQTPRGIATCQ